MKQPLSLKVKLGGLHLLCAVATQGNPGGNRDYVKRYKLMSSADGENWTTYEENGNTVSDIECQWCPLKVSSLFPSASDSLDV